MLLTVRDVRYAVRALAKSPTLILVTMLSLGLGVGVNTALYSVFRAVFLQPPSGLDPDRLVRVEPGNSNQISYPNFSDLAAGDTLEGFAAYAMTPLNLRSGDGVEKILGLLVSPTFFQVIGLHASKGRALSSEAEPVVVITHEFWRRRLRDTSDPIGSAIDVNGHAFTVIGVLPEGYRAVTGAFGPDVYLPIGETLAPGMNARRRAFLTVLARLRAGVSRQQFEAAITSQMQALERMHPEDNVDLGRRSFVFPVSGLGSWRTRDIGMTSLVGITAVPFVLFGLVLLIACANVAGLLLARGSARRREIALRLALGASRRRVVGTLLAESLVLSVFGSVAGLLLTYWVCGVISSVSLPQAPGPLHVTPDFAVLGYGLVMALVATLACGLAPAILSTRLQLSDAITRDDAAFRWTSRSVLVSGQVAIATLLLFVSTLFLRSLNFISTVDPGFNIDNVVIAHIDLDQTRYPGDERIHFAARAVDTVQALPGVVSASLTNLIPLGGDVYSTVYEVRNKMAARTETYWMNVGPAFFRTMNIRLQRGRDISADDRAGAPAIAVVNDAFVKAHGLASDPLGSRVRAGATEPWLEIVGIVDDSKYAFFGETPHPVLYKAFLQAGGNLFVVAHSSGPPAALTSALRRALVDLDRSANVESRTMREATSLESSLRRLGAWLLGSIGLLGLGLALIGLYGLMSYTVTRRTREIGVRMALGASAGRVQWMVLRSAVVLVGIGVCLGTVLAILVARPLEFLMSGVQAFDPWTMACTAALLLGAGLAASYVPSLRATEVDPMVTLRSE